MTPAPDAAEEFTPTALHERLDRDGLLEDAHGPGCYALEIGVPNARTRAESTWREHFEILPADDAVGRLARASNAAYVGASSDVYDRLMDHARSDVRKASVLEAFPPVAVLEIVPFEDPFEKERSVAYRCTGEGWVAWCNGEVLG